MSRRRTSFRLALSVLAAGGALAVASPALATPLLFTVSGFYNGSFLLDSNPTPTSTGPDNFVANISGQTGDFVGEVDVAFYNKSGGGGIASGPNDTVELFGPQLYSGTFSNPSFRAGAFVNLVDFNLNLSDLTISVAGGGPGAPAPELATGLLSGLLALGALAFSRRRRESLPA